MTFTILVAGVLNGDCDGFVAMTSLCDQSRVGSRAALPR
jgi:hypothetical protein